MTNEIEKLKELKKPKERRTDIDGDQLLYKFKNGYGASVIHSQYLYGGDSGLLELAVLGKDGRISYDTPITNDVVGHLDADEAFDILKRIEKLESEDDA